MEQMKILAYAAVLDVENFHSGLIKKWFLQIEELYKNVVPEPQREAIKKRDGT